MSAKTHLCIRCGIAVHNHGAACADCHFSDNRLVLTWRAGTNRRTNNNRSN